MTTRALLATPWEAPVHPAQPVEVRQEPLRPGPGIAYSTG